jgi:hypothetical protein
MSSRQFQNYSKNRAQSNNVQDNADTCGIVDGWLPVALVFQLPVGESLNLSGSGIIQTLDNPL